MSNAFLRTTAGNLPPVVATSYTTDNGTAVPLANILIIHGTDSTENNDNGIIAKGGVVGTGTANEVDIVLTNRATGTLTTADGSTQTALTFSLGATPGVYYFRGSIVAFDSTDIAGGAYDFTAGARTTGVAGTELGAEYKDIFEEVAMTNADFNVVVSGNNLVIQVIGIAAKTINWNVELTYRFVS